MLINFITKKIYHIIFTFLYFKNTCMTGHQTITKHVY